MGIRRRHLLRCGGPVPRGGLRAAILLAAPCFGSTPSDAQEPPIVAGVPHAGGLWITVENPAPWPVSVAFGVAPGADPEVAWRVDPPVFEILPGQRLVVGQSANAGARDALRWRWVVGRIGATHDPDVRYRVPLQGEVLCVAGFGEGETHGGRDFHAVDLACPLGTAVFAARAGVVIAVRADVPEGPAPGAPESGNFVRILHADGTFATYAHLAAEGVSVAVGERVQAGQRLAVTGRTGRLGEPHLHFAVARADLELGWRTLPHRFATTRGDLSPRRGQRIEGRGAPEEGRAPLAKAPGTPCILCGPRSADPGRSPTDPIP